MAHPSKLIGSFWFTDNKGNQIGIVKVDTSDWLRFYAGQGKGVDEKEDEKYIHRNGEPVDREKLLNFIDKKENKEDTVASYTGNVKARNKVYETERRKDAIGLVSTGIGIGIAIALIFLA